MKLTRSTLTLMVRGRKVTVSGEAYLPGYGSPDFVVYKDTIVNWDDGSPISQMEKEEIVSEILREGASQKLDIVIE